MTSLAEDIEKVAAETRFSGVVRLDSCDGTAVERAYGHADRRHAIANTPATRLAIASGAKGFTAVIVMSLMVDGALDGRTTARSVLGTDLPLIRDDVTVEQLLSHRSGIGDYFDESADHAVDDYVLPVSMHRLAESEDYLSVLDGHETAFEPDAQFAYCNGGYVVLALIAERVAGQPFRDLVRQRVCEPAGLGATEFLRSDELHRDAACGYLHADGLRTNVFHLPVRGSGDGGLYSTAADIRAFWLALVAGRIVPPDRVDELTRPRSYVPSEERRYGMGFWLHKTSDVVMLEGYDAGVSFWTAHDPATGETSTVISNTSEGAWDLVEILKARLPV